MRATPLLPILLALTGMVNAQTHTQNRYLDSALDYTSKGKRAYTVIISPGAGHWVARANYRDGFPILNISFKDEQLTIKDGSYLLYYAGGKLRQSGHFTDDMANGIWQSWFSNGQVRDSGMIVENGFSGVWNHWYENGQLRSRQEYSIRTNDLSLLLPLPPVTTNRRNKTSQNKSIISYRHITGSAHGPWQSWYSNGLPEATGTYKNDSLDGVGKWFRENGMPSTVETYANGKIIQLECYDENGKYTGNSCSILKPVVFTHPFFTADRYITDRLIKLYNLHRGDVGRTEIEFTVTKTGRITHLIVNGASAASWSPIYYIIATMPKWSPAVSHNRNLDYTVYLTIY